MAELALDNNHSLTQFAFCVICLYPASIFFCFFAWVSWIISGDAMIVLLYHYLGHLLGQ
jgi:hypothetical protein